MPDAIADDDALQWSRGRLERVAACPACHAPASGRVDYERTATAEEGGDRWRMSRCPRCRSLYLDPRPDAESLPRAYSHYYTHAPVRDRLESRAGWLQSLVNGYLNRRFGWRRSPATWLGALLFACLPPYRRKLDYFGRHLPVAGDGGRRLLDIGCGNGDFLVRAQAGGWQVRGCEPDPNAAAAARSQGLDVLTGDAFAPELEEGGFDVVMLSHVLEHVAKPDALLQRAADLLKPGGRLWLATPNAHAPGLRAFGAAWWPLHMPYHLCITSASALEALLTGAGFNDVAFVRRGAHAASMWRNSRSLQPGAGGDRRTLRQSMAGAAWADLRSTLDAHCGEELVVVATKR